LIEPRGRWARILQNEYGTVPVTINGDRPGSPSGIQLFSKRIFVLESFQRFRRGILGHRGKNENTRRVTLTPPAIKDKVFILPQHFERTCR
jgi:hypothetical protein